MQIDNGQKKPLLSLIKTKTLPIIRQLEIEEALLHTSYKNYCFMNSGTNPAIVMGLSNNEEDLLHLKEVNSRHIPVYKRFTGGGTVVVDENTLFVSLILNKEAAEIESFPEAIMRWNYELFAKVFKNPDFHCIENDFAIGGKKCAGNAQYLKKQRWIQHSSFLWDLSEDLLSLLKSPKKAPLYRQGRSHSDFLIPIKTLFNDRSHFFEALTEELEKRFEIEEISLDQTESFLKRPYRKQNKIVC